MRERRISKEFLKCVLTHEEKDAAGEALDQAIREKNEAEGELKTIQTQIKSKIAQAEATMAKLSSMRTAGFEMRYVECEIDEDFETNTVTAWRKDTGEVAWKRAMTFEERQGKLL